MKRKIFLPLLLSLVLLSGLPVTAQPADKPVVAVRFFNPVFDCPTQTYCVEVQFMTDTPGLELFGMNVRFFYDDNVLEFLSMDEFQGGYHAVNGPLIETFGTGSGAFFGLPGSPMEQVNGVVELTPLDPPAPIYLSGEWTKLFNICFHVDDPAAIGVTNFCPVIIWDLEENPPELWPGYLDGDDGVVMSVVDFTGQYDSTPTTENVVHLNWQYDGTPESAPVGFYVPIICISTICGYIIPLSNWSLFLGIGLMLITTLFIYRRRISG
jgi:hypothetical protein